MSKKDVADMMLGRRIKWLKFIYKLIRRKMTNKNGQKLSVIKTTGKMGYDGLTLAIAFIIALVIGKGTIPADDTVTKLLPTVAAITIAIKMLIRGVGNLISFKRGK